MYLVILILLNFLPKVAAGNFYPSKQTSRLPPSQAGLRHS